MKPATLLVYLCALVPLSVFGFGADDASRPPPPAAPQASDRSIHDAAGAVKAGEDQVLLPALRGLAIANTTEAALALQQPTKDGIALAGFPDAEAAKIREIVTSSLGKPVSLRSLNQLSAQLETAFRTLGRPFVQVSFPGQEITSGVIALLICPARAGQVLVTGKSSFGLKFAVETFRTRQGQEISGDVVLDDLDWLNENPLRRASISYADGATPETLDLTLHLRAPKPWRAYGGIDNQLSDSLGDERIFLGFQYGDLFSLDHRVTAQFTSSLDFKSLKGVSGIYEIPLPIRHLLQISAGFTESETSSSGPIDQSGQFSRMALDYRVPLPRWRTLSHEWRIGMEFRKNDYDLSSGTSESVDFFQIVSGWKCRFVDRLGMTRAEATLLYSPGHGTLGSKDADFIALGADGAESVIARIELERSLKLGEVGALVGRVQGQWANSKLLSSDQISAGGMGRIRGFDEAVGYASKGLVASVELRSKAYPTSHAGEFQGISFIDAATLSRDNPGDAGQLGAWGIGVNWHYQEMFAAKLALGIPIVAPDDVDADPRLYFSVSTNW